MTPRENCMNCVTGARISIGGVEIEAERLDLEPAPPAPGRDLVSCSVALTATSADVGVWESFIRALERGAVVARARAGRELDRAPIAERLAAKQETLRGLCATKVMADRVARHPAASAARGLRAARRRLALAIRRTESKIRRLARLARRTP